MATVSDGTTTFTPLLVLGYDAASESGNIVHRLLNNQRAVSLRPASLRSGSLELLFMDLDTAAACQSMHRQPGRFTLTFDELPSLAMQYVLDEDGALALRKDQSRWVVEVPFVEVSP